MGSVLNEPTLARMNLRTGICATAGNEWEGELGEPLDLLTQKIGGQRWGDYYSLVLEMDDFFATYSINYEFEKFVASLCPMLTYPDIKQMDRANDNSPRTVTALTIADKKLPGGVTWAKIISCLRKKQMWKCCSDLLIAFADVEKEQQQSLADFGTGSSSSDDEVNADVRARLSSSVHDVRSLFLHQDSTQQHQHTQEPDHDLPEEPVVFLTYSGDAVDEANRLKTALQKKGIHVITLGMLRKVYERTLVELLHIVFKKVYVVIPVLSHEYLEDITPSKAQTSDVSAAIRYMYTEFINRYFSDGSLNWKICAYRLSSLDAAFCKNLIPVLQNPRSEMDEVVNVVIKMVVESGKK